MSSPTQDRHIARVAEIEENLDRAVREAAAAVDVAQMREAILWLATGTGRLLTLVVEESAEAAPTPPPPTDWLGFDVSAQYINFDQVVRVRFGTDDDGLYAHACTTDRGTWELRGPDALRLRDIMETAVRR